MRMIRVCPDVDAKLPATPPQKRKRTKIPALNGDLAKPSRHTKETVIQAIMANLSGESYESIADRLGTGKSTVVEWCLGINRRLLVMEAERRWRAKLKRKV